MKLLPIIQVAVLAAALAGPLRADETPAMEAFYSGVTALQEAAVKPTEPQRQKGWAKAEKLFREAIELKHDYADAYNKLGQSLFNQGHSLKAIEEFLHAVRIDPRLTEAWYGMGYAYENVDADKLLKSDDKTQKKLGKTKFKDAIAAYEKAVAIDPRNDLAALAKTHFRLGVLLREEALKNAKDGSPANLREAIKHAEEAVKLDTDYPEALNELGRDYDIIGRYPEAIDVYSKAILGDENFAEAYSNRGVAWWKAGNWDKAVEDCRKAIEIDPKFPGGHYNFAEVVFARVQELRSRGLEGDRSLIHVEAQKAIDDYRVATELDPEFTAAWYGLAKAYQGYHDFENAAKIYEQILAKDKKQKEAKALLKALKKEEASYQNHIPKQYRDAPKK
jgi:tetratricopeptide (TPR) repeat protein